MTLSQILRGIREKGLLSLVCLHIHCPRQLLKEISLTLPQRQRKTILVLLLLKELRSIIRWNPRVVPSANLKLPIELKVIARLKLRLRT